MDIWHLHIYAHVHTYIYTNINTYTYTYILIYIYTYVHIYKHTYNEIDLAGMKTIYSNPTPQQQAVTDNVEEAAMQGDGSHVRATGQTYALPSRHRTIVCDKRHCCKNTRGRGAPLLRRKRCYEKHVSHYKDFE
jgi:hypothetical protein